MKNHVHEYIERIFASSLLHRNFLHRDRQRKYISKLCKKHGGDGKQWSITPSTFPVSLPCSPHAQSRWAPHFMTRLQVERPLLQHPKFLIVWYRGSISQFLCLGLTFLARALLRNRWRLHRHNWNDYGGCARILCVKELFVSLRGYIHMN